jgi:hypothetical protein
MGHTLDVPFHIYLCKYILNYSLNFQTQLSSQEYMDLKFIKKKVQIFIKKNLKKTKVMKKQNKIKIKIL